ncbi:MAG: tetratricopeptide repeat protein, partial [Isosphaeraceae bacterium]
AEKARDEEASQRREAVEQKNRAVVAEALAKDRMDDAIRQKQRADEEAAVARAVNEFLQVNLLGQADIGSQPGGASSAASGPRDPNVTVRTLLDRAAREIEGKFAAQPLTEASICQTLGDTYRALGQYAESQPHLERSLALRVAKLGNDDPQTLIAKNNLGILHRSQGKFDRAEVLHKQAVAAGTAKFGADHPDTLTSKSNLAAVYLDQGMYDQAETVCKEVLDARTAKLGADHIETLISKNNLAIVYRAQKKYGLGETLLEEAIAASTAKLGADHPDTLTSKSNLAFSYNEQGKYDRAETLLNEVIPASIAKLGADHPLTLASRINLAFLYEARGSYDRAELLYREAIDGARKKLGHTHPDTQSYVRLLIGCYLKMGQPAKADAELSKVIELNPGDGTLHRDRARLRAELQRSNEALIDFTRALEINPADWGIWDDRGMLYLSIGHPEKALSDFTKSIAIDPKVSWLWQHRSLAYRALNRWQEAIADLSKSVELAPQDSGALNGLARLLATCPDPKLRDPDRAVKTAKQLVGLAPKEGEHWNTLGIAQYRAGDWKEAIVALEKSVELRKGGDAFDWLFLAMAQWQLNHKDEAGKWYAQAVQWMDNNAPKNEELGRFRSEAAELMKMAPRPKTDEPRKKSMPA